MRYWAGGGEKDGLRIDEWWCGGGVTLYYSKITPPHRPLSTR